MTKQEAIERLQYEKPAREYHSNLDKVFDMAIEALENQSTLLDFLVSIEISNICEDDRMQEWCEENCAYACPQKECYLKYAGIERKKNER